MKTSQKILWVAVFAASFALVESAIVVYLRSLYYPGGFSLPLRVISKHHYWVELSRELATIIILASVGFLAGPSRWQKFAYFMMAFGIWDIFYYIWLKVTLNWPDSVFDWDVLFLVPVPWIGPVIAPVLISVLMVLAGLFILRADTAELPFRPNRWSWIFSLAGTFVALLSFTRDFEATLSSEVPKPYLYELFVGALILYICGFAVTFKGTNR